MDNLIEFVRGLVCAEYTTIGRWIIEPGLNQSIRLCLARAATLK